MRAMLAFGTSLIFISQVVPVRNNTNSKQSSKGNADTFQNDAVSIKRKADTSQKALVSTIMHLPLRVKAQCPVVKFGSSRIKQGLGIISRATVFA